MAEPDFKAVAAAALATAAILLPQWIGGKRVGNEWVGERRANGGPGDSWSVNLTTGHWLHGAGSEKGLDLVSLYAALNHLDQRPALLQVAPLVGVTDSPAPVLPPVKPTEKPAEPIPEDAPALLPHPKFGPATATYVYGRAFVVCRYDLPDRGKSFVQFTWRGGKWSAKGHPAPRPIYGAHRLAEHQDLPVIVVEGEKCADAARAVLPRNVILTWAGGAQAVRGSDWSPLAARQVILWPDADEPGRKAMAALAQILLPIAGSLRVIDPKGQPEGWDIADAIAGGWDSAKIATWAKEHLVAVKSPEPQPNGTHAHAGEVLPPRDPKAKQAPARSSIVQWQDLRLETDTKGVAYPTLSNVSQVLQFHAEFAGRVWLDTFRGQVWHTLGPVPRQWTDADSRRATAWIQQHLQMPKVSLNLVQESVMHAGECNPHNSLTDWLDSLQWDGTERLSTWLADCLGAERSPHNDAVARNWPISMVARAYAPGCQVDTMVVLEGKQGRGKSSFLEILASPWFAALQMAFGEKDFFQAIQGRWLIEIPDMTGFSRREHTQILATITTRVDVYRKSHGRITEEHPRATVFAATSENDEYLQEQRGRRRYWPIRCGHIELDSLRAQREQIFAEAVRAYRAGANWHEMPGETDEEQAARASRDIWTDRVLRYAQNYVDVMRLTSAALLENACEMKPAQHDDAAKRRIYRIMMENGYKQLHSRDERYWKKIQPQ